MAILREGDARVGCLAVPIAAVAGFVVIVLLAAALGLGATPSTIAGAAGAMLGAGIAVALVRPGS